LNYCVVVATYSILVYVFAKIEYVSVRAYLSNNRIRMLPTMCRLAYHTILERWIGTCHAAENTTASLVRRVACVLVRRN